MYDVSATADRIELVHRELFEQWAKRNRVKVPTDRAEAIAMIDRCSADLILPPTHLATVLRRIGPKWDAVVIAYLAHAKDKAKEKKRAAGNPGEQLREAVEKNREGYQRLTELRKQRAGRV